MENKLLQLKIITEFKDLRDNSAPIPEKDWNVIWVLSGPQRTFEEDHQSELGNETRDRLATGFKLAREVTSTRLNKELDKITVEDVKNHGPIVYFNGWPDQNLNIKGTRKSGILEEQYLIPRSKLVITNKKRIDNTPDQFKFFPKYLLKKEGKIVVVSDMYHLPRTKRISQRQRIDEVPNLVPFDRLIFYSSEPLRYPFQKIRIEIRKIPQLITEGLLPPRRIMLNLYLSGFIMLLLT